MARLLKVQISEREYKKVAKTENLLSVHILILFVRKALKKEGLAQVLDYDPEFLDWYFSVHCERELNAVIKQRKYYYEHKKRIIQKQKPTTNRKNFMQIKETRTMKQIIILKNISKKKE